MPFVVFSVIINPNTTKFYTHQLSPDRLEITISGEDPIITTKRFTPLTRENLPDPDGVPFEEREYWPNRLNP